MQINKQDNQILEKLKNIKIPLKSESEQTSKDNHSVQIPISMLNTIVREFNILASLWRKLLPEEHLQSINLQKKKNKFFSRQKQTESTNNRTIITGKETVKRTGIENKIFVPPRIKTEKIKPQLIYDLFKDRKVIYHVSVNKASNYQQQNKQYSMAGYSENYQIPKQLKNFSNSRLKPSYQHKYSGVFGQSNNNYRSYSKTPKLYTSQIGSKSYESGAGSYKSIDMYLTDGKEMVKNEI